MIATRGPRRGLFAAPFDVLADPVLLARLAAEAEAAGWDGVFLWDHIRYRHPVRAVLDPWIGLAAIASATERVRLGPMVTPLPRRRVQVVARQAAALDLLSAGRLVLGFGIGGNDYGEFSRYGDEPDARVRGALLDEGLAVLGGLLSGHPIDHDGAYLTVHDPGFLPAPASPVPIWVAGRYPNRAPLQRARRFDGYFPIDVTTPRQAEEVAAELAGVARSYPPPDLVLELPPAEDLAPWRESGATWLLTRVGPFDIELGAVRSLITAGPG